MRTLTHEEVVAKGLTAKHPAQLLEPYKGNIKIKHRYRFLDCPHQHEHEVTPNNIHVSNNGCGRCHGNHGPTFVYLLEHEGYDCFKIGIDPVSHQYPSQSRIHRHGLEGWVVVHKVEKATRGMALGAEKTILGSWSQCPNGVTQEQMPKYGWGETVSRDLVDVDEVIAMMDT